MNTIRTYVRPLLLSMTLAVGTLNIAPEAKAGIIFSGLADIEFTQLNVSSSGSGSGGSGGSGGNGGNGNNGGGPGPNNYNVSSVASIFDTLNTQTGNGYAELFIDLLPNGDWDITNLSGVDPLFQGSESYGEVGLSDNGSGSADAQVEHNFAITFINNRSSALTFELLFSTFVSADLSLIGLLEPGDDAAAFADIRLSDLLNGQLLYSFAEAFIGGPLIDSESIDTSLSFVLQPNETNTIFGTLYSEGFAEISRVPAPSALWLMAGGLVALYFRKTAQRPSNQIRNTH